MAELEADAVDEARAAVARAAADLRAAQADELGEQDSAAAKLQGLQRQKTAKAVVQVIRTLP